MAAPTRRGDRLAAKDATHGNGGIEVYLAEDILQGEEVPFYVTWREESVESIQLSAKGFEGIVGLYNAPVRKLPVANAVIVANDLKTPGYLGGVLRTTMSDLPVEHGELEVSLRIKDGKPKRFVERRILHSARLTLERGPTSVAVPLTKEFTPSIVEVRGAATVMLDIEEAAESELPLVLPSEIMTAYEKFGSAVVSGVDRLKQEFPQHAGLIEELLTPREGQSLRQFYDDSVAKLIAVKNDKSFIEAYALVYVSALLGQTSVKDTLFIPLIEYLESNAATKVFLRSPFVSVKVPAGGGRLSFEIIARDLLGRQCGKPVAVQVSLVGSKEMLVPVKDIVRFRRVG